MRSRELDCAFARLPDAIEDDELIGYPLVAVRTMVVLPRSHRFATRRVVRLRDLADEDWVVIGRGVSGSFPDDVVALCRTAGFVPRVALRRTTFASSSGWSLLASGLRWGQARDMGVRGIQFVSTSPDVTIRYGIVARRASRRDRSFFPFSVRDVRGP